jgi:hypothetical protein
LALIANEDSTTGGPVLTLTQPSAHVDVVDAPAEISRTPAVAVFASPPATQFADAYYCKVNGRTKGQFQVMGTATLADAYPADTRAVDREVGFTLENALGLEEFTATEGAFQRMSHAAVFLHEDKTVEVVIIKTLEDNGGGFWTVSGVIRGIAGTQRVEHPAGTRVWFPQENGSSFRSIARIGTEAYNIPLSVVTAPLNLNFTGQETSQEHEYAYTNIRPYPPANLMAEEGSSDDAILSWSARNRHSGWLTTQSNIDNARPHDGQPPEADFFEVSNDDNDEVETATGTTITLTDGWVSGRTYSVRAFMRGHYSDAVEILIP